MNKSTTPLVVNHFAEIKCNTCGTSSVRLQKCGKCKLVYYCSVGHQKIDWRSHKLTCQPPPSNGTTGGGVAMGPGIVSLMSNVRKPSSSTNYNYSQPPINAQNEYQQESNNQQLDFMQQQFLQQTQHEIGDLPQQPQQLPPPQAQYLQSDDSVESLFDQYLPFGEEGISENDFLSVRAAEQLTTTTTIPTTDEHFDYRLSSSFLVGTTTNTNNQAGMSAAQFENIDHNSYGNREVNNTFDLSEQSQYSPINNHQHQQELQNLGVEHTGEDKFAKFTMHLSGENLIQSGLNLNYG